MVVNKPETRINKDLIDSLTDIVVINNYAECFRECILKDKRDNCIQAKYLDIWKLEMIKRNLLNTFNVIYDNSYKQSSYVDSKGIKWYKTESVWKED